MTTQGCVGPFAVGGHELHCVSLYGPLGNVSHGRRSTANEGNRPVDDEIEVLPP